MFESKVISRSITLPVGDFINCLYQCLSFLLASWWVTFQSNRCLSTYKNGFVVQKRDKLSLSPCPNVILFWYQWSYLYVGCFSPPIIYPTVLVEGRQRNHSYDSVRHTNTFVRLGYCVVWWHGNNSEEDKDRFEDRTYREHASTAGFVTRSYRPVWTRTFGIHRG